MRSRARLLGRLTALGLAGLLAASLSRAAGPAPGELGVGRADPASERVLALAPHVVETLYAVGAGDQIVGTVDFSDHPEPARALPRIGSYRKIALEAALRLRPTLAIAMDEDVIGIDELEQLGVRVEFSHPRTVEAVLGDILHLGALTGHEVEARALEGRLRTRLERLRKRRPSPAPRVFYEIWHEPLITAGRGSFIHDALAEIGALNVFGELPGDGPRVSVEAVLRAHPEVLIIPGESRDVAERERTWKRLLPDSEEAGAEPVRVIEAAHDLLHRPGPRLIDGMEQLQADLARALAPPTPPAARLEGAGE